MMVQIWQEVVWKQFGAAIDMLENAVTVCPASLWSKPGAPMGFQDFWYMTYHALFFLDYYLSEQPEGFSPPAPFTLGELDPAGLFPDRVYSKDELLSYLEYGRQKARSRIAELTTEQAMQRSKFTRHEMSVVELMLYNMRHVQHHAAQLNLLLRQGIDSAPRWVSRARIELAAK